MAKLYNLKKGEAEITDLKGVTITAEQLNALAGMTAGGGPAGATFVIGEQAGYDVAVTVQINDANGDAITERTVLLAYLSDNEDGEALVETGPTGGWAVDEEAGEFFISLKTDKCGYFGSQADGTITITISEGGAKTCYLVIVLPNGTLAISDAITFVGE